MVGEILNNSGIQGFKFDPSFCVGCGELGTVVSEFLVIIYFIATFLTFFWLIWGAVEYIVAAGDKEKLGRARNRIIWAIVGLFVVFGAFLVAQFGAQIFGLAGKTPLI